MFLYHGTSERHLKAILANGICPRGTDQGNWDHTVVSANDRVYLTKAYAGYFAMCATKDQERYLILEVNTKKLDEQRSMRPDEDFLEQCSRGSAEDDAEHIGSTKMNDRTIWYRDHADYYAHYWKKSVVTMGNAAHMGPIPLAAITRYSLYDPRSNEFVSMMLMDPMITPLNYKLCGDKYRGLTQWLIGESVKPSSIDMFMGVDFDQQRKKNLQQALDKRDGLEIFEIAIRGNL